MKTETEIGARSPSQGSPNTAGPHQEPGESLEQFSLGASRSNQSCPHLDLRLLAFPGGQGSSPEEEGRGFPGPRGPRLEKSSFV